MPDLMLSSQGNVRNFVSMSLFPSELCPNVQNSHSHEPSSGHKTLLQNMKPSCIRLCLMVKVLGKEREVYYNEKESNIQAIQI